MRRFVFFCWFLVVAVANANPQSQTIKKPNFPFEVSTKCSGRSQINVLLHEQHFSRVNLVNLFSYLGQKNVLPVRAIAFTNRLALERELSRTCHTNTMETDNAWDRKMRSLAIRDERPGVSSRAYYYKDDLAERFSYDLHKDPARFINVTIRDSRRYENTSEFLLGAVKDGYDEAVQWSLRQKPRVNIDFRDLAGNTPLSWALWLHNNEIAKLLVSSGADVNATTSSGSPLFTAIDAGNTNGVLMLIQAEVDINRTLKEGKTPLMAATLNCDYSIIKALLQAGARADRKNVHGKRAIDYCELNSVKDLFRQYQ